MKANIKTERCDGRNLRHQSAVGLLLLTLLVASPLQGFSQSGVISSDLHTGANLNSLFGSPTNSVTVDAFVTINNSTSGSDAVSGSTHPWNLLNDWGTLNGNVNGVNFSAGGSVNNQPFGTISGGLNGVLISGSPGNVINYFSSITGTPTMAFTWRMAAAWTIRFSEPLREGQTACSSPVAQVP